MKYFINYIHSTIIKFNLNSNQTNSRLQRLHHLVHPVRQLIFYEAQLSALNAKISVLYKIIEYFRQ